MQYVYCFVQGIGDHAPFPRGFGGKQVRLVPWAGISAVVSSGNPEVLYREMSNVLIHQKIVHRALELSCSIIPCRFGMSVADEASTLALLRKNAAQLKKHLLRLEGKVEVEIKAIINRKQHKAERQLRRLTVGERYLLAKQEQLRQRGANLSSQGKKLAQELNNSTSPFWAVVKPEEASFSHILSLRLLYLVKKEELASFQNAYSRVNQEALQCKLLYSGPWPPYNFAEVVLS